MGYDLHITRGEWYSDDKDTITAEQWRGFADADPDLEVVGWSGNGEPQYAFIVGDSGPSFLRSRVSGTVHVRGAYSDEALRKVIELAARLGAVVQGDEGEYYRLTDRGVETSFDPPAADV